MNAPTVSRAQIYGHDCLYCAEPLDPWTAVPVTHPGSWDLYQCPTCCDWCDEGPDTDPIKPKDDR